MSVLIIPFTKMSGAGNDFVVVDNRGRILEDDGSAFARVVSHRRKGIGADGVLLLERSSNADFLMKYYNADGSYGGFCGNGGRCIARFAFLNGIGSSKLTFEALGRLYDAEVNGDQVRLKMQDPNRERLNIGLEVDGKTLKMHSIDTGAPHVVIFLDENPMFATEEISSLDVPRLGREIRYHSSFGEGGTNVNFVKVNNDTSIRMRTYERGVEGETLACGTGAVACALIASRVKGHSSPQMIIPKSNEALKVEYLNVNDRFVDIFLEGNAEIVYEGKMKYDPIGQRLTE